MEKIHIDKLIERIREYQEINIVGALSYGSEYEFNLNGCECCQSSACDTVNCTDMLELTHDICNSCLCVIINDDHTVLQYSADEDGYIAL